MGILYSNFSDGLRLPSDVQILTQNVTEEELTKYTAYNLRDKLTAYRGSEDYNYGRRHVLELTLARKL